MKKIKYNRFNKSKRLSLYYSNIKNWVRLGVFEEYQKRQMVKFLSSLRKE